MNSIYQKASFLLSVNHMKQLPADEGYEVAFAGRSNAGKSTAINILTNNSGLARTSKTPGRTQLLNFFQLDDSRRLVDLPGYGFAKVPKKIKQHWDALLDEYLRTRECLRGLILLMDCRHPLKLFDEQMILWCAASGLPLHILLTKRDKLKRGQAASVLLQVQAFCEHSEAQARQEGSEAEISVQLFSALQKVGVEQCIKVLDKWLQIAHNDAAANQER